MARAVYAGPVVAFGGGEAVRDEVELFGWPEQMLACRHRPVGPAAAGVVICLGGPFGQAVDEGRAARLGRALARAGVAAQRFHSRGAPPSDGDPAAVGFGSLVDDAAQALDLLRERTGIERVGIVGARLGALVAARLAQRDGAAPVALWEPVVDARDLLEQAARARAGRAGRGEAAVPDLFASALCTELVDGAAVGDLAGELGSRPAGVLVVQTAPGDGLRPAYRSLVEAWRSAGVAADACHHPCDAERAGAVVPGGPAHDVVETTAAWLVRQLTPPLADGNGNGNGNGGAP